jgi:hypothetical protein
MAVDGPVATDQEIAMPRALLFPLTMMVLIATATAMLASTMILPMSEVGEVSVLGDTEVVQRFYAAVNETIATGNLETLRHVVNPSFADETPLPGVHPGRAGLEEYLVALHHTTPSLRLEADVISAASHQVVAQVQVRDEPAVTTRPAAFGEQPAVWSPIEVFRVTDSMVVGRWGHTDGLTLVRPLAAQTLVLPVPTPRVVSLMRITQAPGARWDAPRVAGPRLLILQDGVLDVQAVPGSAGEAARDADANAMASDGDRADATERVMLAAGNSWQVPAGAHLSTTNVGSAEAQLLAVTFSEPQIPNGAVPQAERLPSGVEVQILAGDLASDLGTGSLTVTLEQIALAPDAGLNLSSTEGPILVAVETGHLEATVCGTAWVRRSRDGVSVASRGDVLTTDNGMLLQPNGVVALRTGEQHPAHVLVVAIQGLETNRVGTEW